MAGVGDEGPLPGQGVVQPGEQPVHGPGERRYLVLGGGHRQPLCFITLRQGRSLPAQPLHRGERGPGQQVRTEAGHDDEHAPADDQPDDHRGDGRVGGLKRRARHGDPAGPAAERGGHDAFLVVVNFLVQRDTAMPGLPLLSAGEERSGSGVFAGCLDLAFPVDELKNVVAGRQAGPGAARTGAARVAQQAARLGELGREAGVDGAQHDRAELTDQEPAAQGQGERQREREDRGYAESDRHWLVNPVLRR